MIAVKSRLFNGKTALLHRHEALALLRLTGPLVLAQLSQTAMGFVDTVMAGRVGAVDLAAVAVGSSLFFPVYLFLIGLLCAATPLAAQALDISSTSGNSPTTLAPVCAVILSETESWLSALTATGLAMPQSM